MKMPIYQKCENIVHKFNNIIKKCNRFFLVMLVIILAGSYFKQFIKSLLIIIGIVDEKIKIISELSHFMIETFYKMFALYSLLLFIYYLAKRIYIIFYLKNQKKRYNKMLVTEEIDKNEKELYKNIYNYFTNKKDKIPIFVSGEWGAGKTYTINNFLNNYYKYSNQNVYKISCFGITTKEILMERIKEACENEDNSLFNQVLYLIGEIPIIGAFLKNILEKKYDINNIKNNSIFIFDNFERIEWSKYGKVVGHVTVNYGNAISKYDIVVGVIDELIEKYNMKVIIIGNEREMVPDYFYDTFICKLGCKKYTIKPKEKVFEDIWYEILDKEIVKKEYREDFIKILKEVKNSSEIIWKLSNKNNIRILYRTIYNYISYILFLKEIGYEFNNDINEKISIYYSDFMVNICNYNEIEDIKEYDSIGLFFEKQSVRGNRKEYYYLADINAMWCVNRETLYLWKNMEENYFKLKEKQTELLESYRNNYISKKNCMNLDLNIKKLEVEDMFCLLKFQKQEFRSNAIKFLQQGVINFKNIDNVAYLMDTYKVEEFFKEDSELILCFFNCLYNKENVKAHILRLEKEHESFKKCNQMYNELNKLNSNI